MFTQSAKLKLKRRKEREMEQYRWECKCGAVIRSREVLGYEKLNTQPDMTQKDWETWEDAIGTFMFTHTCKEKEKGK